MNIYSDPFESIKDFPFDIRQLEQSGAIEPLTVPDIPWNTGLKGTYKNGPLSEEHKKKISETKRGVSNYHPPHSEETKKKISEARKGKPSHNKGKKGEGTAMYGKKHSEETKQKMSESAKGKNTWSKDKPRSEETKRKIAESQRKRHALKANK